MKSLDVGMMLDDVRTLVEVESPSDDPEAVAACTETLASMGQRLVGSPPQRHGNNLRWVFGDPTVMVLGHHDTVWPVGTLANWPFEVADGRATGPGCFDMKAGLVVALHAVAALPDPSGITLVSTCDEEIGAPTSRDLVVSTARGLAACLVTEPSAGTAVKTARKGMATVRVRVTGRAAHAGLAPEDGVNASVELAHQLVEIASWPTPDGTTVVPTVMRAGTTMNTVPAEASLLVDMRSWDADVLDRLHARLLNLTPVLPGAVVEVETLSARGPLEPAMSAHLHEMAVEVAADRNLGEVPAVAVGGVSDGNFTASVGTPTLDGLGVVGGNAHAQGEWFEVDSLLTRARLLNGLLAAVRAAA